MMRSKQAGFSLVEILIAMAILGILLATLGNFFVLNQKVGSEQITSAKINNDVRLAFLRLSDVTSQAQYIYPAGQKLTLKNGTLTSEVTTGANALAILVPEGTTYCPTPDPDTDTDTYCGFAFVIESSAVHAAILGSSSATTGDALAEYRFTGLSWPQKTLPSTTWTNITALHSPLVNSVDKSKSSLAAAGTLDFANYSNYDDSAFDYPTASDDLVSFGSQANALVTSVQSSLSLKYTLRGKAISNERDAFLFARSIPRAEQPE